MVVNLCWPSITRNLETPTGTLRAGMVTIAPISAFDLLIFDRSIAGMAILGRLGLGR